jgi:signal transduction protein with GAF and PtsI domain
MGKRISEARIMRKKAEKLKLKAKKEILRDYPKLMEDPEQRKKVFELIDNASVAVDNTGNIRIIYQNMENKDLINLS